MEKVREKKDGMWFISGRANYHFIPHEKLR